MIADPALLPLLVAIPLLAAGLLICLSQSRILHAVVLIGTSLGTTAAGVALVTRFAGDGGAIAHGVSNWPFGVAIPLAADMFTALMLVVTGLLTVVCAWFAYASGLAANRYFAPLVLVLVAGVNGALMTADLFNLFVFIEVMLLPSYGLFVLARPGRGTLRQVAGARAYVTVNLLTSTIFLIGVGLLYGTAGTVNMAELSGLASQDPAIAAAGAVCLVALAVKATVAPVHGWLAVTYPSTSPAVTALFSGLHTKVAVYGIYRMYSVLFDGDSRWLWVGVVLFSLTMVVGVLGAVGEKSMRSILAFHMISQLGYILLGVALFTLAGLTAGIFYLLHHMIVKASLFLSTGAIEVRASTGRLDRLPAMLRREPVIAVAFFIAALSLAGIPPFSGFVAKLTLILAAVGAGEIIAVVVMLAVSLITLLSMLKIWNGVFWGGSSTADADQDGSDASVPAVPAASGSDLRTEAAHQAVIPRVGTALAGPAVVTALLTVALGLGAELLIGLSATAAEGLLDSSDYVQAVISS